MIAQKIKKIPIEELRPGMCVANVFNKNGVLLYSTNTLIVDYAQIEALRRQGVGTVGIATEKKGDTGTVAQKSTVEGAVPHLGENVVEELFDGHRMHRALEIRNETLLAVQQIMTSARTGRIFSISSIAGCIASVVDDMLEEPDLLFTLCRIKAKSRENFEHSVNVAMLMAAFSTALGFSREKTIEAGIAGMLHDIGKIRLPDELLEKRGTCTRQEDELVKRHPEFGMEIVAASGKDVSPLVRTVIGQHHERLNGSGYPHGLKNGKINEMAMVCAVADTYDLLTTNGMHHRLYLPQEALALIFQGVDDEYPRAMVEHFTKLLGIYPVGSFIKLDTGEMGVVVKNNRQKLLTPVVRILFNEHGERIETPYLKDLSRIDSQLAGDGPRVISSLDPQMFNVTVDNVAFTGYNG